MNLENKDEKIRQLAEVFKQAGADDPEGWASSEVNEGINQLARFSFLKAITSQLLKEDDLDWIDNRIKFNYSQPTESCSQIVPAMEEMIGKGVSRESIVDLIRVTQYETLWHACCIIDKVYETGTPIESWGLFELDDDYNPTMSIGCLHESLDEFDPSKKGLRPRAK